MKKLISYITEAFVLLFVVIILFYGLVFNGMIVMKSSILFLIILVDLAVVVFGSSQIICRGIKATIDLLFMQSIVRKGVITDIIPCERSFFSEKWEKGYVRVRERDYYVNFEVGDISIILRALSSLTVEKNKRVLIRFGRFSHVILEIKYIG